MTDQTPQFSPPHLTIAAAAAACKVSTRTIRRYLDADRLPGAYKAHDKATNQDRWLIPITALLDAGLKLQSPDDTPSAPEPAATDRVADLERELERTRAELRIQMMLAAEREKALEDARLALRAITAGTPTGDQSPPAADPAAVPQVTGEPATRPARRWPWHRR